MDLIPTSGGHIDDEKTKKKAALRNRCKSRAFDKAWSTYSEAFRTWFEGLGRSEQTKIINGDMKLVNGEIQNHVMESFHARESVKKEKGKLVELGQTGLIQEEAEQRLGGASKLEAAVARGLGERALIY